LFNRHAAGETAILVQPVEPDSSFDGLPNVLGFYERRIRGSVFDCETEFDGDREEGLSDDGSAFGKRSLGFKRKYRYFVHGPTRFGI
jgi:hypothetical protein